MKQKYEEAKMEIIMLTDVIITSDQTLILDETGGSDGTSWGQFQ